MSPEAFQEWGWRVPFLASAVLLFVGLWVRLSLLETPAFTRVVERNEVVKLPLARVFRRNGVQLLQGTFIMLATYVLFYLMTAFTLTYGTSPSDAPVPGLGYARIDFLWMLIAGVVFFGVFTLVAGPLAERFGRRKMLGAVTIGIVVFGLLWVPLFSSGFVGTMAMLVLGFSLMGLTFGPMAAFLPELFPSNVRYTGSAIAYNFSSILGAALAPFIAVALWRAAGGSTLLVGLYLVAAGAITFIALLLTKETRDQEYVENSSVVIAAEEP